MNNIWLWAVVLLTIALGLLALKIYLMKKSLGEISSKLAEKLSADTNTLIDVSSSDKDVKKLAHELNKQLLELRKKNNLYVQGDLELKSAVSNISHDLRTPLTAISSYLELLESSPEKSSQYIGIIKERTEALTQLTEELFRYSVITSPEYDAAREPVLINSLLEESLLAYYAPLQERGITPEIEITEEKIIRSVNRSALLRVFSNLLGNAMKYSDGDLHVSLNEDGLITFANKASDLNEVQVGRLFERFYTIESARKSTGLGLSIARILVEQMNGTISADYLDGSLLISVFIP